MNLFIDKSNDEDCVLDKHYNIEYIMSNGKYATFNNILRKADDGYYWFSSKEDGFDRK